MDDKETVCKSKLSCWFTKTKMTVLAVAVAFLATLGVAKFTTSNSDSPVADEPTEAVGAIPDQSFEESMEHSR